MKYLPARNLEEVILRILQIPLCDIRKQGGEEFKVYLNDQLKNFVQQEPIAYYTVETKVAIETNLNKFIKTVMGDDS